MGIPKYQIRKFTIRFSKTRAKEERKQRDELETTLKSLEKSLSTEENIAEGTRIRSRCQWYEE